MRYGQLAATRRNSGAGQVQVQVQVRQDVEFQGLFQM